MSAAPGPSEPVPPDFGPTDVLITQERLRQRVAALGAEIAADYAGRDPLLVGILKGAFVFMADLVRTIPLSVEVDFMAVSSYGSATRSSGVVRIVKDLDLDLTGRHVLLVEDIVDSGLTLAYLRKTLAQRNPASFEVCALMVREATLRVDASMIKYIGFRIPDEWVVGYGLDVAQRWRNLPDIRTWRGRHE
jgi:hypoxanthine phosphoribosyltransferase